MTEHPPRSDNELIRLIQHGELEAFTELYERYLPVIFRRVRYTVPQQDVEDVTQEIFIAAMRSVKSFKGQSLFRTWLQSIARRKIADYYRYRKPPESLVNLDVLETHYHSRAAVVEETAALDASITLRQGLQRLPEHYQEVLLLRFADDLKFREIAELQGVPMEAVKSLFRRAVSALRKQVMAGGLNDSTQNKPL